VDGPFGDRRMDFLIARVVMLLKAQIGAEGDVITEAESLPSWWTDHPDLARDDDEDEENDEDELPGIPNL
jgi:hypothetical protein